MRSRLQAPKRSDAHSVDQNDNRNATAAHNRRLSRIGVTASCA